MTAELFRVLGWNIMPMNYMFAYVLLGLWTLALVLSIIGLANSNKPNDVDKQKSFNYCTTFAMLALILTIYLAIRIVS